MPNRVEKIVEDNLKGVISNLGFDLYEVEYAKKQNGMNLTLFITRLNGDNVDINDCELVHRTVDPLLDEINPTGEMPYYLNVSSLGIDRPIKTDKDFLRVKGKMINIKLFKPFENKKEFCGVLQDFDGDKIVILEKTSKIEKKFLRCDLALVKEEIDF